MIDDQTKVIPGHGPLSNKKELKAYVNMLVRLKDAVSREIASGKSLEEIQKSRPTKAFDAQYGDGFLSPDNFIQILYTDLSRRK